MTAIGYHASHEGFEPDELPDHARHAERASLRDVPTDQAQFIEQFGDRVLPEFA